VFYSAESEIRFMWTENVRNQIARHLTAGRMADMDGVFQVEISRKSGPLQQRMPSNNEPWWVTEREMNKHVS
jgi:hypothetical protein